jgi:uncharacterized membrane protein
MKGRILFACIASAMVGIALGAPLLTGSHPLAALALRDFFSGLCHQNPTRSFFIDQSPAAVCVRCLGIYCGIAMGAWLSAALFTRVTIQQTLARRIFMGALLLNGIDAAAETLHLHGNLPLPRFLLGASLGLAAGVLLSASQQVGESANHFAALTR